MIYVDYGQPGADLCIQNPRNSMSWRKNTGTIISFSWLFLPIQRKSPGFHLSEGKEAGIPEYNCTDTKNLNEGWQIKYIPRFLLIDENFKIIDAYAPRPSQPEAVELLDKILKK